MSNPIYNKFQNSTNIYFSGNSIKSANKRMAFSGCMYFPALKNINSRDYTLIKNGNTWYLTTSTNNQSLYELSKNKDKNLYLFFFLSKVLNNDDQTSFPIHIILEKECYSLLLEFNLTYGYEAYQPLILNLTYDPYYLGPQLDSVSNLK